MVAHGEGRAEFRDEDQRRAQADTWSCAIWKMTELLAAAIQPTPNGSPDAIAGPTSEDGRVTIMMPHPERVIRTVQNSWHPDDWGEEAPLGWSLFL